MKQQECTSAEGEKFQVTFSGGIAEYPENSTVQTLYRSADAALYEAQRKGRDRIESL